MLSLGWEALAEPVQDDIEGQVGHLGAPGGRGGSDGVDWQTVRPLVFKTATRGVWWPVVAADELPGCGAAQGMTGRPVAEFRGTGGAAGREPSGDYTGLGLRSVNRRS